MDVLKLVLSLTIVKVLLVVFPVYLIAGGSFFTVLTTKWDSLIFETIASNGYSGYYYAFPPLYPYMIKALTFVTGSYNTSAFIITNVFSYVFPIILYKVFDFRTALVTELFPVYVVFSTIPYSDVVYLTFLALTFLLIKERKVLASSVAYSLSIFTFYSIAWTLPAFIVGLKKKFIKFVILPLITGAGIFFWYYRVTGTPFYYFEVEKAVWGVMFTNPIYQDVWLMNGWFTTQPWAILGVRLYPLEWLVRNVLFELFILILILYFIRSTIPEKYFYLTYSLLAFLPLLLVIGTPAISIPRLLLAAFPAFYNLKIGKWQLLLYVAICATLIPLVTLWQLYSFFS
ncbi:hypothetical protein HS7_15010 [Sulfolobales archaeon HS-7]|nr:hypothetical protein HS7_15010 [Sulfolobales archaeon HS-7]